ncbi:5576_t:CDS:2 [Ambispora leptoticha]|uniref:5576_t:CDS:1 n=1 Tax=Ambispora leptoticha TaxID=144679 RepID=A0A9N8ZJD5_9GLOM|nr:5576_t:CDS:2 [Ambispora leptoticha]
MTLIRHNSAKNLIQLTIWCPLMKDSTRRIKATTKPAMVYIITKKTGEQRTHKINLENNETTKEEYKLKLGDEIAQGIYLQLAKIRELFPVDSYEELEESTQRDQGFGSTDRRVIINCL